MQLNEQQAGPNEVDYKDDKSELETFSSESNDQKVVHPKITIVKQEEEKEEPVA